MSAKSRRSMKWIATVVIGVLAGQLWAFRDYPPDDEAQPDRFLLQKGMSLNVDDIMVSPTVSGSSRGRLGDLAILDNNIILILLGPECGRPYGEMVKWAKEMTPYYNLHDLTVLWVGVHYDSNERKTQEWDRLNSVGERTVEGWRILYMDLDTATEIGVTAFPQVLILDYNRTVVFSEIGSTALADAAEYWKRRYVDGVTHSRH